MIRLCSGSETRASILRKAGLSFTQSPIEFEEDSITTSSAKSFVFQATLGKYQAAIREYDYNQMPILCADTVVVSKDKKILRKAKDVDEARAMLLAQSASTISIITCMIYKSSKIEITDLSSTEYIFDSFNEDDIKEYLQSDLWMGKAGACMVEGFCKKYIKSVKGYESCAMGLSIEKLLAYI